MLGSLLTQWTIRLALACLAAYLAGRLLVAIRASGRSANSNDSGNQRACNQRTGELAGKFAASRPVTFTTAWPSETLLRWLWTAGCLLFIAHVACAFQFTHHWSHQHAWRHTADETKRMMGVAFGDGIYFSYVFLLLWAADVACLWLGIRRPRWLVISVYLFLFFIAMNGAIVFEAGPTRPVGIVVVALVLLPLAAVLGWKHLQGWLVGKEQPAVTAECDA